MSIRPMTREDLPAVASLAARSFHHSTWTPWLSPTQQHLEDATEGYKLEYKLLLSDNSALCTVYEIENTPSSYAAAVKASEGEAKKIVGVVVWIRAHGDCGVDVEELRDVESKCALS